MIGGEAQVAHLALADQVVQGRQRLLHGGRRIGPLDLVEVDDVRAEPAQAVLDLLLEGLARQSALVGAWPYGRPDLGGQHGLLAAAAQRLTHDHLRLPLGVAVGRVDEVDPRFHRPVDDADRLVVVRVAPLAEHHRAQAEGRDLEAGRAEITVVHASTPAFPRVDGPFPAERLLYYCLDYSAVPTLTRRGVSDWAIQSSRPPWSTSFRHSGAGRGGLKR